MRDELVNLPDLTPQQKQSTVVSKVFFRAFFVTFICLLILTCFCGMTCPTVPQIATGHTHPFFDKIYGRYVFLTDAEDEAVPILFFVSAACILVCVVINLDLQRQLRSARKNRPT
ncbi:MAG: hypothetical protein WA252_07075 [Candidatus Sulfotelmatobacter sp.]